MIADRVEQINETQGLLTVWIRGQMLGDSKLMNEVDDVYSLQADKDADFPYIVYRVGTDSQQNTMTSSSLFLGLWDYGKFEDRILRLRGHLLRLFDQRKVCVDGKCMARIWHSNGDFIPEPTEGVWHREEMFNIRNDRKVELENIYNGSEN